MSDASVDAANHLESAAQELERAAAHLRVAAGHAVRHDVPRMCAHAFAAEGHVHAAQQRVAALAVSHASRSNPE